MQEEIYKNIIEPLRLKNLQSIKLVTKSTTAEIQNQMICLENRPLSSVKEFIVKIPAVDMKNKAPKRSQSKE